LWREINRTLLIVVDRGAPLRFSPLAAAVDHTQNAVTVLPVVLAVIQPLDGERIVEDPNCGLKADDMLGVVLGSFAFIPFKLIALS
jgi:hypothetical protein